MRPPAAAGGWGPAPMYGPATPYQATTPFATAPDQVRAALAHARGSGTGLAAAGGGGGGALGPSPLPSERLGLTPRVSETFSHSAANVSQPGLPLPQQAMPRSRSGSTRGGMAHAAAGVGPGSGGAGAPGTGSIATAGTGKATAGGHGAEESGSEEVSEQEQQLLSALGPEQQMVSWWLEAGLQA